MNLIKKTVLGAAAGATALATATPAMADDHRYRRHHDNTGAAVAAGIAGLAIGAIIASDGNRYDRRYDRRYYNGYYNGGYYNQGYYPNYTYYYPNYAYTNGGWYNGYRYNNGYFYDRRGYRAYDRNSWSRRWDDGRRYHRHRGY